MIEGGSRPSFPFKPLQSLFASSPRLGKEFQCDTTSQPCVLSFVDYPHAAPAQFSQNAVVGHGLADDYQLGCSFVGSDSDAGIAANQRCCFGFFLCRNRMVALE